jgi:hypothetical protein
MEDSVHERRVLSLVSKINNNCSKIWIADYQQMIGPDEFEGKALGGTPRLKSVFLLKHCIGG